ncbi:MAG: bifunctional cobalt-precorrin-7 (C(5))-methyltransferase/cobalt-precorrin-6B (C(15))-methyltransferase, partial [Angelakisella sp.]
VVVTAIALETLSEASAALKELAFQNISVTQIAVSRTNAVGGYHMLTAQNPVFILSAGGEH